MGGHGDTGVRAREERRCEVERHESTQRWCVRTRREARAKAESLCDIWLAMAGASITVAQHDCGLVGGATCGSSEWKASDGGGGSDSHSTVL